MLLPRRGRERRRRPSPNAARRAASRAVRRSTALTLDVEASIGVALSPDARRRRRRRCCQRADIAMYAAKERTAGRRGLRARGREQHDPRRLAPRATCAARSRPRTSSCCTTSRRSPLDDERLVGVEALAALAAPRARATSRRASSSRSPRRPASSARSPLACPARGARASARRWRDDGPRICGRGQPLGALPARPDLPDLVERVCSSEHGCPARSALEITESAIMADPAARSTSLERLHALGSGSRSTTSAPATRRWPTCAAAGHELKIDRSFVIDHGRRTSTTPSSSARRSTSATTSASPSSPRASRRPSVVALRALGCDIVQGYHLARPMPAADVSALFERVPQRA